MRNTQIAQIVMPQLEHTWQTSKFSVFARQSRVEINAQRDLEDMLEKLDDNEEEVSEAEKGDIKRRRKRKFLELAIPCGTLTFICIVFCFLYLVTCGQDIAQSREMNDYLVQLTQLETTLNAIIKESETKTQVSLEEVDVAELDHDYAVTNKHLNDLLTAKTRAEWELINRVQDFRRQMDLSNNEDQLSVDIEEAFFYMQYLEDIQNLITTYGLKINDMKRWKDYYPYMASLRKYFQAKISLNILRIFERESIAKELIEFFSVCMCNTHAPINKFASFAGNVISKFEEYNQVSKKRDLTASFDLLKLFKSSFNYTTNVTAILTPDTESSNASIGSSTYESISAVILKLTHIEQTYKRAKENHFSSMDEANSMFTKETILCFTLNFVAVCCVVLAVFIFVVILKDESKIVISVSDWLKSVSKEFTEQEACTSALVKKIIPLLLLPDIPFATHLASPSFDQKMNVFHVTDATFFMCSIARFDVFFDWFSAPQTLHILTLVMELIDERIEQYQVIPVTRMGHCQIVISNTVETQRQAKQHACEIANLAIDIMSCCSDLEIGKETISKLQMKIGIHSGPCIGMLRTRRSKMEFNVFGTSVAILQQVHKTALPNRIQISETTQKILTACETYRIYSRGKINVKGLPSYKIYWLDGRKVSSTIVNMGSSSSCSVIGSWIELEQKPLYRLDEEEGVYEPIDKAKSKRYSQMSMDTYRAHSPTGRCAYA